LTAMAVEKAEYDAENIFAKILAGDAPCFKVFENASCLAFLDAFPTVEGHTVVVPKGKGSTDFLAMRPDKAAAFLEDVQRVARAVKEATGAAGVTIWQNNGADAGQTVFHPHTHIIPRSAGDGMFGSKAGAKISDDAAKAVQAKIELALNPPKPLKKARFGQVAKVRPEASGLNLKVKVVGEATEVDTKAGKFIEVLCGDETGTLVVSLRENQKDLATNGAVLEFRNASSKMIGGHLRLAVDKWGKVAVSDEGMEGEVEMAKEKNISMTEYELVGNK